MTIDVKCPRLMELRAGVGELGMAVNALKNLDSIEAEPMLDYKRFRISRDSGGYSYTREFDETETALSKAMFAAGQSAAEELGRANRARALAEAIQKIEALRSALGAMAALAAIELGQIAREASARG